MSRAHQEFLDELEREMQKSSPDRHRDEKKKWAAAMDAARRDQASDSAKLGKDKAWFRQNLDSDSKQPSHAKSSAAGPAEGEKDHDERFVVSTPDGDVHLNRVVDGRDQGQGFWTFNHEDWKLRANSATDQDPFSQPDQAISWLLSDEYSPLNLDQTLPYKLDPSFYKSDGHDSYFRNDYQTGDLYPRFRSDSLGDQDLCDPRLAEKVNWRAAFRDLLDIQTKGAMSSPLAPRKPSHNKDHCSTGAGCLISQLVNEGSLGPSWHEVSPPASSWKSHRFRYGNSAEAWVVPPFQGPHFIRTKTGWDLLQSTERSWAGSISNMISDGDKKTLLYNKAPMHHSNIFDKKAEETEQFNRPKELDDPRWSCRPALEKAASSLICSPEIEPATLRTVDRVLRLCEQRELKDEIDTILGEGIHGLDLVTPNILSALFNDLDQVLQDNYEEKWEEAKSAADAESPPSRRLAGVQSPSSSGLASPQRKGLSEDRPPNSIISTLTTIQSWTLPDGRVETKRVLKRKFADGSEENSESTETQPRREDSQVVDKVEMEGPEPKDPVTSEQVVKTPEKKQGGWFWN